MNDWKPTFRFTLAAQEAPRVQASLFAPPLPAPPRCAHLCAGVQERLDGGLDQVCIDCGAVTAHFAWSEENS